MTVAAGLRAPQLGSHTGYSGFRSAQRRSFKINHEATELQLSRLTVVTQGFGLPLRFTSFDSENAETFHRVFFDVILKGWPIKDLLL